MFCNPRIAKIRLKRFYIRHLNWRKHARIEVDGIGRAFSSHIWECGRERLSVGYSSDKIKAPSSPGRLVNDVQTTTCHNISTRPVEQINPMLGFRGCRLSVVYPEITEMQARAVAAAAAVNKKVNTKGKTNFVLLTEKIK